MTEGHAGGGPSGRGKGLDKLLLLCWEGRVKEARRATGDST